MTFADLEEWERELVGVVKRIRPLFYRAESKKHAEQYLRGLLSPLARKNGWTISEYVGASEPKALQRFLNLTPWDAAQSMPHVIANRTSVVVVCPACEPARGMQRPNRRARWPDIR